MKQILVWLIVIIGCIGVLWPVVLLLAMILKGLLIPLLIIVFLVFLFALISILIPINFAKINEKIAANKKYTFIKIVVISLIYIIVFYFIIDQF